MLSMKRSAFILLLLLLVWTASAEIHGSFGVGNMLDEPDIAFAQIQLEWFIDWLIDISLFGGWLTWFQHVDGHLSKAPFQDLYFLGGRVYWDHFYLDLRHECTHPVVSGSTHFDLNRGDSLTSISVGVAW